MSPHAPRWSLCALIALAGPSVASADPCEPRWSDRFYSGILSTDPSHPPTAVVFEGSSGSLLAMGPVNSAAGLRDARGIAAFDGTTFHALGEGFSAAFLSMTAGAPGMESLYIAGRIDGSFRLGTWDGSAWTMHDLGAIQMINDLVIHDDGSGPALYATGGFQEIGGVSAANIARWDGQSWHPLGSGIFGAGIALASFDDGSGPALYVSGPQTAGGQPVAGFARWDGQAWEAAPAVTALNLAVHDDGGGAKLYAINTAQVLRLDSTGWTVIASFSRAGWTNPEIQSVETPAGPRLAISGRFESINGKPIGHAALWDGSNWSSLGGPLTNQPFSTWPTIASGITSFDDGSGPRIYVTGEFRRAGEIGAWNLARSDGEAWEPLGLGMSHGMYGGLGPGSEVYSFAIHDDGHGAALYAGGSFGFAGGRAAGSLARFTGDDWIGLNPDFARVVPIDMASFDDGTGPALYIANQHSQNRTLMRLRDDLLEVVPGISHVSALGVFKLAGTGGAGGDRDLYAATGQHIFRHDRGQWARVTPPQHPYLQTIHAMIVHDAGDGPMLYAGGQSLGGSVGSALMRWTPGGWEAVEGLSIGTVRALEVHHEDPAGRPSLFVGGLFSTAGGQLVRNIAKWDGPGGGGGGWSPLGSGLNSEVLAMASFGDGRSSALYAGVATSATSPPNEGTGLARWDGRMWEPVGGGTISHSGSAAFHRVFALQPFVDQGRETLMVGGSFGSAGGTPSHRIAQWIGCPPTPPSCYANCDGSTTEPILNVDDFLCFINRFAEASLLPHEQQVEHYANCDGSTQAPVLTVDDFTCFINAFAQGCP